MHKIEETKGFIHSFTHFFSHTLYGKIFGGVAESRASQYDTRVLVFLITGISLTVIGAAMAIFFRKKK